jgi:hypothetical protein
MSCLPPRPKCLCCRKLFVADPRVGSRQKFCSEPECQKVSKAASQKRWLRKNGNGDLFRGPNEVARVQRWRQDNPGYWKRKKSQKSTHQPSDNQQPDSSHSSCNAPPTPLAPLQDSSHALNPVIVGLISHFTGSTLQEEIAATVHRLFLHGQDILGRGRPESSPKCYDSKTPFAAGPAASHSPIF